MIFLSDLGRSFKEICSTILQLLTYKVHFPLCCVVLEDASEEVQVICMGFRNLLPCVSWRGMTAKRRVWRS